MSGRLVYVQAPATIATPNGAVPVIVHAATRPWLDDGDDFKVEIQRIDIAATGDEYLGGYDTGSVEAAVCRHLRERPEAV